MQGDHRCCRRLERGHQRGGYSRAATITVGESTGRSEVAVARQPPLLWGARAGRRRGGCCQAVAITVGGKSGVAAGTCPSRALPSTVPIGTAARTRSSPSTGKSKTRQNIKSIYREVDHTRRSSMQHAVKNYQQGANILFATSKSV